MPFWKKDKEVAEAGGGGGGGREAGKEAKAKEKINYKSRLEHKQYLVIMVIPPLLVFSPFPFPFHFAFSGFSCSGFPSLLSRNWVTVSVYIRWSTLSVTDQKFGINH